MKWALGGAVVGGVAGGVIGKLVFFNGMANSGDASMMGLGFGIMAGGVCVVVGVLAGAVVGVVGAYFTRNAS